MRAKRATAESDEHSASGDVVVASEPTALWGAAAEGEAAGRKWNASAEVDCSDALSPSTIEALHIRCADLRFQSDKRTDCHRWDLESF